MCGTWGPGLPVVLQDTRTQGGVPATTTYLYGLDLIAETSGAGVTSYYLTDGLGSSTQLTDSAGAVTDSYDYDVWGAHRTQSGGTTANDFRYTGEQNDRGANRGLYYPRARHYDPALGRFLGKDPLPLINRYAYVRGNPTNYYDPSGLSQTEARRAFDSFSGCYFDDSECMEAARDPYAPCFKNDVECLQAYCATPERGCPRPRPTTQCSDCSDAYADAWRWLTSREPECYFNAGITGAVGIAGFGRAAGLPLLQRLVIAAGGSAAADYIAPADIVTACAKER